MDTRFLLMVSICWTSEPRVLKPLEKLWDWGIICHLKMVKFLYVLWGCRLFFNVGLHGCLQIVLFHLHKIPSCDWEMPRLSVSQLSCLSSFTISALKNKSDNLNFLPAGPHWKTDIDVIRGYLFWFSGFRNPSPSTSFPSLLPSASSLIVSWLCLFWGCWLTRE